MSVEPDSNDDCAYSKLEAHTKGTGNLDVLTFRNVSDVQNKASGERPKVKPVSKKDGKFIVKRTSLTTMLQKPVRITHS